MPRRVSMPTADDLFRPTSGQQAEAEAAPAEPEQASEKPGKAPEKDPDKGPAKPSGRVRHDEKMTVYLSSAELYIATGGVGSLNRTLDEVAAALNAM